MKPLLLMKNLYLGDKNTAKDLATLKKFGIVAIVNISGGKTRFRTEFAYHKVNLKDSDRADIGAELPSAMGFIVEHIKRGGVLVHCQGAFSRSPSFAIAYLAKHGGMTVDEAIIHVKNLRPSAKPKSMFIDAIKRWIHQGQTPTPTPAATEENLKY